MVDSRYKIFAVGDAIDLWKRLYTWERENKVEDIVTLWWLPTLYNKEIVAELRRLLHWEPGQIRDRMRRTELSDELLDRVLRKHPVWALQPENILKENLEALEGSF